MTLTALRPLLLASVIAFGANTMTANAQSPDDTRLWSP